MTDPIKRICDHIMHHIAKVSAEADNPASLKFGRKMLLDTIRMQLDHTTHAQFDEALYQLINGKYLKPLGQYTVGPGTGKGIKKYDLSKFTLYTSITPEQLEAEQKAKADKNPPAKKQAADNNEIPRLGQRTVTAEKRPNIDSELTEIDAAIERLRQQANKPTRQIKRLEQKLALLDGLTNMATEPLLQKLLSEIKTDLQEIAA